MSKRGPDRSDSGGAYKRRSHGKPIVKLLCPFYCAGAIIGKGGDTIKDLMDSTGCDVKISKTDERFPTTSERVISVQGDAAQVEHCILFCQDKIRKDEPPPNARRESVIANSKRKEMCKLVVSDTSAGRIIGKGGQRIKDLKDDYNVIINITRKEEMPRGFDERCVSVEGDNESNIDSCVKEIVKLVCEDETANLEWIVYYNDWNNRGDDRGYGRGSGDYHSRDMGGRGSPEYGGRPDYGRGPDYGGRDMDYRSGGGDFDRGRYDSFRDDRRDDFMRRDEGYGRRDEGYGRRDEGYGRRDEGYGRRDDMSRDGYDRRDDYDRGYNRDRGYGAGPYMERERSRDYNGGPPMSRDNGRDRGYHDRDTFVRDGPRDNYNRDDFRGGRDSGGYRGNSGPGGGGDYLEGRRDVRERVSFGGDRDRRVDMRNSRGGRL